jgi:hypothetical protein
VSRIRVQGGRLPYPARRIAVLDQRYTPSFTAPGGSPQLHLLAPPVGIALGHTRESRPGSQCRCNNAAERKAAECSFETAPSCLTATSRGGKHRSISKLRMGLFVSFVKLAGGLNTTNLQKSLSRIATNSVSRLQSWRKWKGPGMFKFKICWREHSKACAVCARYSRSQ